MYEQLDIFSMLPQEEPPVLLEPRQTVYLVNRADIITATATSENWICCENNRGYRLIRETGGYEVTWNDRILAREAFLDYKEAEEKAGMYLKDHADSIILAGDIKPLSVEAYSYIRNCDNREMTAFYCDIGEDMYYIKEFMTFHHICCGKKAIKKFTEQMEYKYENIRKIENYTPKFKNMYRAAKQSGWEYTECECSYVEI